jgi:hypothetical protein
MLNFMNFGQRMAWVTNFMNFCPTMAGVTNYTQLHGSRPKMCVWMHFDFVLVIYMVVGPLDREITFAIHLAHLFVIMSYRFVVDMDTELYRFIICL